MEEIKIDNTTDQTLTGQELLDFIKFSIDSHVVAMKSFMKEDNSELPMIFQVLTSDMKILLFPPTFTNLTKELAVEFVLFLAKEYNAVAVITVTECWTLPSIKGKNEYELNAELDKYGSISNHPDRVECFNVMASYNIRGKSKCDIYMVPILRNPDGTRSLDEANATREVFEDIKGKMSIPAEYLVPIEL